MNLIDTLSKQDKESIATFVSTYGGCVITDATPFLQEWAKNKKTLYRLLGGKLRETFPVELALPEQRVTEIKQIYKYNPAQEDSFEPSGNEFVDCFIQRFIALSKTEGFNKASWSLLSILFNHENIVLNEAFLHKRFEFRYREKRISFYGTIKPIKTIRKLLVFFDMKDLLPAYEKWRNAISNAMTKKSGKFNVTISIHPLDLLTASDNNSNWHSCLSWSGDGSYHSSTIELMTSNMAAVAYIENTHKPYEINGANIPNKSWRVFCYIHKDIICVGNAYPYKYLDLNKIILKHLEKIADKNLHWKYKYSCQKYKDMDKYISNGYCRDSQQLRENLKKKKKIIIYTNKLYNDLIEYSQNVYLCSRNKVHSTKFLCASGPLVCLICGKRIPPSEYNYLYEEHFCLDCSRKHGCSHCIRVFQNEDALTVRIFVKAPVNTRKVRLCSDCLHRDFFYDEEIGIYCSKRVREAFYKWKKKNL